MPPTTSAFTPDHLPRASRLRRAIETRDVRYDGRLVFGVTTTRIYCRPSCPARRPRPENVSIFETPDAAERAGFRACKRCRPREATPIADALNAVVRAARYIESRGGEPAPLSSVARAAGRSPHHLQRVFTRFVGVSPRQYAHARRVDRMRERLRAGAPVADAVYEAGFGSSSRAYEDRGALLGMSPARFRRGGEGERIVYAAVRTALGWLLLAATERGVCRVALGDRRGALIDDLRREFPRADVAPGGRAIENASVRVARAVRGEAPHPGLPMDIRATAFQRRVWEALRRIPRGATRTYAEIAREIGAPAAARAVGRACAANPVALVVPCHRVVRGDQGLGGYRWGAERKARLLEAERAAAAGEAAAPRRPRVRSSRAGA